MKIKILLLPIIYLLVSCTTDINDSLIYDEINNNFNSENYIPKVNVEEVNLPLNFTWSSFVSSTQEPVYLDNDDTPDIIGSYRKEKDGTDFPVFMINDYSGVNHYTLDMREYNPSARDSLNNIFFDYGDVNKDGNIDIFILYNSEIGNPTQVEPIYKGTMSCILLSKGEYDYDVVILEDTPEQQVFDNYIIDIDFDGYLDLVYPHDSYYFKNINGSEFVKTNFPMNKELRGFNNKVDWNGDGDMDFISIDPFDRKEISIVTKYERIDIDISNSGYDFLNQEVNPEKWDPSAISTIDADGDGDYDLIISGFYYDENLKREIISHKYFENNSNKFSYIENKFEDDYSINPNQIQLWVLDINKDGLSDLYYPLINYQGNDIRDDKIYWLENTKDGFKINKNFNLKVW